MLDRPTTREGWLARAAALKIEGPRLHRRRLCGGRRTGRHSPGSRRSTAKSSPMSRIAGRPISIARSLRRARRSRAASGATRTRQRKRGSCCVSPSSSASMPRSSRCSRRSTSASRSPIRSPSTSPFAPIASSTTPNSPTSSLTKSRRSARTTWRWCARSRLASSARSCRGTIRSSSPPGSSARRWSRAIRSC